MGELVKEMIEVLRKVLSRELSVDEGLDKIENIV